MKINTVLTIASCVGCVGSAAIVACAARDTKKALMKISQLDLSPKENVKHVRKEYVDFAKWCPLCGNRNCTGRDNPCQVCLEDEYAEHGRPVWFKEDE